MYCRRPGISLFGGESSGSGMGRTLSGLRYKTEGDGRMRLYTEEYTELKDFIDENFMQPLQKRDMKLVKLNAFNFDYLVKKLQDFSLMYKDAEIFLELIETIKTTMEITDENDKLNEIVYGQSGDTRLEFHTKAVEFLPEYQIYCSLYGTPSDFDNFNMDKLGEIKLVIKNNPAMSYRDFMVKFGLTIDEVEEKEVKKAIKWEDLPDDPQERRKLKMEGNVFIN